MAFATVEDLATRLGRELTTTEAGQGELLIELASLAIAGACDKTEAWIATVNPVPALVRVTCLEAAVRVMVNPTGARSSSEQLGSYQRSESFHAYFDPAAAGISLTEAEVLRVRRAVFGTSSGSATVESLADDIADLVFGCS